MCSSRPVWALTCSIPFKYRFFSNLASVTSRVGVGFICLVCMQSGPSSFLLSLCGAFSARAALLLTCPLPTPVYDCPVAFALCSPSCSPPLSRGASALNRFICVTWRNLKVKNWLRASNCVATPTAVRYSTNAQRRRDCDVQALQSDNLIPGTDVPRVRRRLPSREPGLSSQHATRCRRSSFWAIRFRSLQQSYSRTRPNCPCAFAAVETSQECRAGGTRLWAMQCTVPNLAK